MVTQDHITPRQDVIRNCLAEHFYTQGVGDEFFGFTLEVWVDQGDVVVGADDVAEGGEAFFDARDGDGRGEGGAEVGEFLVGGACG